MNAKIAGKSFLLSLCRVFFYIALLLLPFTIYATFWLSSAESVNKQLENSKAYDVASEAIVQQLLVYTTVQTAAETDISRAHIEAAVRKIATPEVVQYKVENYVTENYKWLNNKRDSPVTAIDLTEERRALARELGRDTEEVQIEGAKASRGGLLAVEPTLPDSVTGAFESLVQAVYWVLRHGFMTMFSLALITGALAFLQLKSVARWMRWAKGAFYGAAGTLLVLALALAVSTQMSSVAAVFIPGAVQSVVAVLAIPLIVIISVTAVIYLILALFAILARAKGGSPHDSNQYAYATDRSQNPGAPSGPAGTSF